MHNNEIIIARLPDIIILALLLSLLLDDDDVTFALGRVIFLERDLFSNHCRIGMV